MTVVSTDKGEFQLSDAAYCAAMQFCSRAENGEKERIAREAIYRYFYVNTAELIQLINLGIIPVAERKSRSSLG